MVGFWTWGQFADHINRLYRWDIDFVVNSIYGSSEVSGHSIEASNMFVDTENHGWPIQFYPNQHNVVNKQEFIIALNQLVTNKKGAAKR